MQTNIKKLLDNIIAIFKNHPKDKAELLGILKHAVLDGHMDNESLRMIEGVFRVSEVQVRDIMIPRPHMTVIDITDQIDEIIKKVASAGLNNSCRSSLSSFMDLFKRSLASKTPMISSRLSSITGKREWPEEATHVFL